MTDLLRPEERAALREAYDAPDAVRANFPSASQLDSERQNALQAGFKQWTESTARMLGSLLRVVCTCQPARPRLIARTQLPLEQGEVFWALLGGDADYPILLAVPRPFAAAVCERLFGAPMEARPERALSASERSLLSDVAMEWLALLGAAFQGARIELVGLPPGEDEEGAGDADEPWLSIDGALRCGDVEGNILVAIAPPAARRLLGEVPLSPEAAPSPEQIAEQLGEIPLDLHAVVGRAELTLEDLVNLRAGDVITLDRRAESLVEIRIDERLFFKARAGLAGQSVALEIVLGPSEVESE